jgi:ABC-type transport system substrate-binding protein
MRWFYIVSIVAAVALGLAPFYFIQPQDTSMLRGKVTVPATKPADKPVTRDVSVMYDTYGEKIKSLDPATCGDTSSASLQAAFYETFYAYHYLKRPAKGDDPDVIIPQLAAALPEISADGLTWTIHLKKGIQYHRNACFGTASDPATDRPLFEADGKTPVYKSREMVADDFVLAFKRIADYHITTELSLAYIEDKIVGVAEYRARTQSYPKGNFNRYFKEDIKGVQAPDPHTVLIRLTKPAPQLLQILAMNNYAPIPREVLDYWLSTTPGTGEQRVHLEQSSRSPEIHEFRAAVGTGAYYLRDFVDGGRIVLCRNPDFRPEFYPTEGEPGDREKGLLDDAGKRVPFVDVIYQDYTPESNPMWMLFLTRQTDTAYIPMEQYKQVITTSKELDDRMASQGIRLLKYGEPSVYYLTFNMDDPVLGKSKSLRQGLCLAFNVEDYIHVLHNDRGFRAVNIVPKGFEGHAEAGPGPYSHYGPDQARAKFEQAKKELVAAGVIGPGEAIPTLTLDLGASDESGRREGELIQSQFRPFGINIEVEPQDWPTLLAKVNRKQFQMYASGWSADYRDPENFLQLFYTPNIQRGTNNSGYSDPEFDKLYEQLANMPVSPRRTDLCVAAIRKLGVDCPVLLLSEPIAYVLTQPWVYNFKPHPYGYGFGKYRRIDDAARKLAGGR